MALLVANLQVEIKRGTSPPHRLCSCLQKFISGLHQWGATHSYELLQRCCCPRIQWQTRPALRIARIACSTYHNIPHTMHTRAHLVWGMTVANCVIILFVVIGDGVVNGIDDIAICPAGGRVEMSRPSCCGDGCLGTGVAFLGNWSGA